MIDDGEKFGEWEGSYNLCYKENWLNRFIELVRLHKECIKPVHPRKYLKNYLCREKIYFPSMLYDEMMEWILSHSRSRRQNGQNKKALTRFGENGFLSGGLFRGFLCKYPESNFMYAKMMYVNILVNQIRGDKYKKKAAKQELWKGQSNHAYWHGRFGGIYLNHLRKEIYRSLLEAELLTRAKGVFLPSLIKSDFDMDGREEILFSGSKLNAYIHTKGGTLFELDYLPKRWNYMDTLSRYMEYYHSYMEAENGYDWYLRKSFIDHFCEANTDIFSFSKMKYAELGDFINSYYTVENVDKDNFHLTLKRDGNIKIWDTLYPVQIIKRYLFKRNRITVHYTITNNSDTQLVLFFGVELNLALSSNKPEGSRANVVQGKTVIPLIEAFQEVNTISSINIEDLLNDVKISIDINTPGSLWVLPVETISQSIEQMDRIYQSTCFMPYWNFALPGGGSWENTLVLELTNHE
jgi:alpha-amylase